MSDFSATIDTIKANLRAAWSGLDSDYLSKVDHNIGVLESLRLLWLPRPDLASGAGSPEGFHHESSTQYS